MTRVSNKEFFTYKLPNKKKWLLTDSFLQDFKDELDSIFLPDEHSNYWNHYNWFEGNGGFYDALEKVSKKHNVYNAIYLYACKLPWYDSDLFDYELVLMMVKRGIIKEGKVEDIDDQEGSYTQLEEDGEIEWINKVIQYDGYSVTKREWRFT